MALLNDLLYPLSPCEEATAFLLNSLKVKFTKYHLRKELQEHPDYPSLLSVADVLGMSYGVYSVPLKTERTKLMALGKTVIPFLANVTRGNRSEVFTVVTKFTNDEIELYDPGMGTKENISPKEFDERFLGTVLLVRADANSLEKNYNENRKQEKQQNARIRLLAYLLPSLMLLICIAEFFSRPASVIVSPVLFTLITFIGAFVSILLLWHEVDAFNPTLKQICQASKKVDCSAVLDSKGSRIFNFSWSTIGFSYFGGMLMALQIGGIANISVLAILSWLNIFALPYIIYSIYYQWRIVKNWCRLCLIIQSLLVVQFVIGILGGFPQPILSGDFSLSSFLSVVTSLGFVFTASVLIVPTLQKAKTAGTKSIELQRIKHNPSIFNAMMAKQRFIDMPPQDLGIEIGNPKGSLKIIKVCNPYCGPCISAHPIIESLIEANKDLCVQIIFNASESEIDYKRDVVKHLMALDAKNDKALTHRALDDWYNSPEKNYAAFSAKYPMNGELKQQDHKIRNMWSWCETSDIKVTPTFFLCFNAKEVNPKFYQLSSLYRVEDLPYLIQVD
jgi:uncharacterized membrane protein/thiol-disulfide isomerase/thioredoxin